MSKTKARTTPGLRRLRASPAAETIRTAVLDDQQAGRAEALARIEAKKAESFSERWEDAASTGIDPAPSCERSQDAPSWQRCQDAIDMPAGFVIGTAPQIAIDAPAPAPATAKRPPAARPAKARPHFQRGVPIEPTPIPTPAERMQGMSAKNAALYMAAGRGIMPTPPDFSKPSYASDRGRLLQLVRLAEEGDIESLRAYAIKTYYSASIELDRYRHRCILALEARQAQAAAA